VNLRIHTKSELPARADDRQDISASQLAPEPVWRLNGRFLATERLASIGVGITVSLGATFGQGDAWRTCYMWTVLIGRQVRDRGGVARGSPDRRARLSRTSPHPPWPAVRMVGLAGAGARNGAPWRWWI
jgi:hypothetical protein